MASMHRIRKLKKSLDLALAHYFMGWAGFSLKRWQPRIIAVTGSVGKTTMLHLLEAQLGDEAHYSHHANSSYGIAFDIVGLRGITGSKWRWLWLIVAVPVRAQFYAHRQKFYVVEIDADRPREADEIASWLKPEATLWVSVGHSHAANFEAEAAREHRAVEDVIADAFAVIPRHTSKLVVIDESSPAMLAATKDLPAKVVAVPHEPSDYHVTPQTSHFTVRGHNFTLPYPFPRELAVQLGMLEALCGYLDIDIRDDWSKLTVAPGRNSCLAGIKGTQLIDSSYNAHLLSMRSMIEMMDGMDAMHKWYVIGDMIEQGKDTEREHKALGEILAASQAGKIILVGRRVSEFTAPLLNSEKTVTFSDTKDALGYLQENLSGNEVVLFKGSQYLEWLVEKLLADPSDVAKLVRQEPAAKARRAKRGLI